MAGRHAGRMCRAISKCYRRASVPVVSLLGMQLHDIRRTAERLLAALVGHAEAPRGRGRPRMTGGTRAATRPVPPATRKKMAAAAKKQ